MKIAKIDKWRIKKLLENRNENENKSSFKNQGKSPIGKMEIKVPLRIGSIILIRKWK